MSRPTRRWQPASPGDELLPTSLEPALGTVRMQTEARSGGGLRSSPLGAISTGLRQAGSTPTASHHRQEDSSSPLASSPVAKMARYCRIWSVKLRFLICGIALDIRGNQRKYLVSRDELHSSDHWIRKCGDQ